MELDDLYQDILLDHARSPRHREDLREDDVLADERNPVCGDAIRLALRIEDGRLKNVRFDGKGCAISTASASLMAEYADGRPVDDTRRMARDVVRWLRGELESTGPDAPEDLLALAGVRQFPMRIKCATMCWHALEHAIANLQQQALVPAQVIEGTNAQ
ncbi:MAG: SUF system NifU family Fe-S cluster assembly protein [Kiritimatiellia bacterium]|nr:SUF system NifU family Fe-S cluster assembly protein [Kiritimatiellia bacterium]